MTNTLDTGQPAAPPAAPVIAPVTRRVRSVGSRGSDAHEREADRAAAAILVGATDVATRLSRTQAAPRPSRATSGEPLELGLRQELERSFGADLRAVRIHHDPAADALATAENARAFTAGAHIWFRSGAYRPEVSLGRELLLHELAHTLQQTARSGSDGRYAVTDASGSGTVQARGLPGTVDPAYHPGLETLLAVHDDPSTAAFTAEIAQLLDGVIVPGSTEIASLARSARRGAYAGRSALHLAFLCDVLKVGEEFRAVREVMEVHDGFLPTFFVSSKMVEYLEQPSVLSWTHRWITRAPLKGFRSGILADVWRFVISPERGVAASVIGDLTADDFSGRLGVAGPNGKSTVRDERFLLGLKELWDIESGSRDQMRRAEAHTRERLAAERRVSGDRTQARPFSISLVGVERSVAMVLFANEVLAREDLSTQDKYIFGQIEASADAARRFWLDALARSHAQGQAEITIANQDISLQLRRATRRSTHKTVQPLLEAVAAAGTAYLTSDPSVRATLVGKARSRLKAEIQRNAALAASIIEKMRVGGTGASAAAAAADAHATFMRILMLFELRPGAKPSDATYRDVDSAERVDIALAFVRFAVAYGFETLEGLGLEVVRSRDAKLAVESKLTPVDDVLLLVDDWREDTRPPLEDLEEDFGRGLRLGGVRVPVRVITNFYRLQFAQGAIANIDAGLDDPTTPLLGKALQDAAALPRPRRWSVGDYRWVPFDGDRRTVFDVVTAHPKTRDQVLPKVGYGPGDDPNAHTSTYMMVDAYAGRLADRQATPQLDRVLLWALPSPDRLVGEVVRLLRTSIYYSMIGGWMGGVSDIDFLIRVGAWLAKGGPERLRDLETHLYEQSNRATTAEFTRLGVDAPDGGKMRLATNHDRVIAVDAVRRHLEKYAEGDRVQEWSEPTKALEVIRSFGRYALPREDGIAQMVALVLESADRLNEAFLQKSWFQRWLGIPAIAEKRFDLVTSYWGLVAMARAWARDPQRRAALRDSGGGDRSHRILDWSDAEIRQRAIDFLDPVSVSFERVREELSKNQGFSAKDGEGFTSPNYRTTIPFDVPLSVEVSPGIYEQWEVASMSVPEFRYQPSWGTDEGPAGAETSRTAAAVFVDGKNVIDSTNDNRQHPVLFEVRIDGIRKESIAASDPRLHALWRAVEDMAFVVTMQNLGDAIGASISLALDLAEFIPGAGQALMVGRIIAGVAMFLASADFADIKAAVSGEMFAQVRDVAQNLDHLLAPETLWEVMLFGDISGLQALRKIKSTKAGGGRRKGAMAKLLKRVREIGPFLANQAEALEEKVQFPLRNTQSYVQRNPPVGMIVALAAQAVELAEEIATASGGSPLGALLDEALDDLGDDAANAKQAFSDRIGALVETLNEFEVPDEIIAPELFVQAILYLILGRLGAKGKIAREILQATGLLAEASELVADALGTSLDGVNEIWRNEVQGHVDETLRAAAAEFIGAMTGAFALLGLADMVEVQVGDVSTKKPKLIDLADEPDDEATAQPTGKSLDLDTPAVGPLVHTPAHWAGGNRLPGDIRSDAERRFGHDFGDVRLHTGAGTAAFTGQVGADALTSGSHIFFRDGMSPRSTAGAGILRHELTHVLQQRGPTPLGGPTPSVRAGATSGATGLTWRPGAETEADRLAAATGRNPSTTRPVEVAESTSGYQPAIGADLTVRVLDRFTDFRSLREFQNDIAEDKGPAGRKMTPADDALFDDLFGQMIDGLTALEVDGLFGADPDKATVRKAVSQHVVASTKRTLSTQSSARKPGQYAINLARQALEPVEQNKAAKKRGDPLEYRLNAKQFVAFVEGYLLVRAGLLLDIQLERQLGRKKPQRPKIEKVELKGLFMGGITRNLAGGLWNLLFDQQFKIPLNDPTSLSSAGVSITGPRLPAVGAVPGEQLTINIVSSPDPAKPNQYSPADFYAALLSEIRRRPTNEQAFVRGKFRLKQDVIDKAVDALTATGDVDPLLLPPVRQYVKPSGSVSPGAIGLFLGSHGQLTGVTTPDRESHHTTQFLLSEYFRHDKGPSTVPFVVGAPGLVMHDGKPKQLLSDRPTIDFEKLSKGGGRGESMPAILIANTTHRRGKLHINADQPDDQQGADGPAYPSSQSGKIHAWWLSAATPATRKPAVATGIAAPGSLEFAKQTKSQAAPLSDAVSTTYSRMRAHMMPALATALRQHETAYYMALARRKTGKDDDDQVPTAYRMTSKDVDGVFTAARSRNDDVMSDMGFRAT